jgi:hypothetical protein
MAGTPLDFQNPINLHGFELQNFLLQNLGTDPTIGAGGVYFNTVSFRPRWTPDGTTWREIYPFAVTNTANTGVLRDGSGNFAAGTITAALTGNASTATALATARGFSITGKATAGSVNFDGTGPVALSVTALSVAAGDIALASGYLLYGVGGVATATALAAFPISAWGSAAADVNMGGYRITTAADPINPGDLVTKRYSDSNALGINALTACAWASTANVAGTYNGGSLTITAGSNGALTMDGGSPALNDRILLKNQSTNTQNGPYTLSQLGDGSHPYILTRATDFDTSAEAKPGTLIFVTGGTVNGGSSWLCTAIPTVVLDTTAITWVLFNSVGVYSPGNGMVKVGSTFHFAQSSAYTVGDLPYASSSSVISLLAAVATGNVLLSGGVATAPAWGKVGLTTHVSGILPLANGGTTASAVTTNGVAYGGASAYLFTAAFTAGQLLIGNGSSVPTPTTMSGDATLSSTGALTIAANAISLAKMAAIAGLSVLGNPGASSAVPSALTASANQVLICNAAGTAVGFSTVNLSSSSAVSGILPGGFGGTGNGFFAVAGPASSLKTFTFKNQTGNIPLFFVGGFTTDGTNATFPITHNLNTTDVMVFVQTQSTGRQVFIDAPATSTTAVTVNFGAVPATGTAYRVIVIGF